ncbi:hypothetical protein HPB50_021667 [Hyalomma asiaticum]|uniref:Uncharacterized protein n=1 Tax=Hyalomma asiaticum TaxID=266040 RepID=A0ACB7T925_HYAAI|nr:hypothetical protein HPB50_021667 [Hyalomma asiaticum]
MEGEVIPSELLLLTCTEQRSGGCQLRRHLTYCNQVLWHAGLQLREDPGDEPGYLNVATVRGMCLEFPYCGDCVRNEKPALVMLQWLLKKHTCIVSLEANYGTVHATSALVEAIASSSLSRLVIFDTAADPPEVAEQPQGHDNAFAFLNDYMTCTARMEIPIGLLLKDDAIIVSLDLSELEMSPSTAEKLIDALIKNCTVEELAIGAGALTSAAPEDTLSLFTRFLLKENATVRKLNLVGDFRDWNITSWCTLAQAISNVGTLEYLKLKVNVSKKKYLLFLEAIAQSQSVRSLTFLVKPLPQDLVDNESLEDINDTSWILALQTAGAMELLHLDALWMSSKECCILLESLAKKSSLTGLTLLHYNEELEDVCRIIRERGLTERIRFEDRTVLVGQDHTSLACEQVASVGVYHDFVLSPGHPNNVFRAMSTLPHIKTVCVIFRVLDVDILASFAACILASSTLTKFALVIDFHDEENMDHEVASQSLYNVFSALSSNTRLNKIQLISCYDFSEDDCKALADAPSNNRHLHELSVLGMESESIEVFLDRLLPQLDQNYNLLLLDVPFCLEPNDQMRAAQEMVRRNYSLVERATRFVMGTHHRDFACAFEILSEEPVLLMNVRRKATVSEQAESVVREARNVLRDADLDTYMRLAGVVKRAVRCEYREDGGRQLDRLHYDCWVHIRRHLKIADVVQP